METGNNEKKKCVIPYDVCVYEMHMCVFVCSRNVHRQRHRQEEEMEVRMERKDEENNQIVLYENVWCEYEFLV